MKRLHTPIAILLLAAALLGLTGCGPGNGQFDITLPKGYSRKRGAETIEGMKVYSTGSYPDDPSRFVFLPMVMFDDLTAITEEEYVDILFQVEPGLFEPSVSVFGTSTLGDKTALRAVSQSSVGSKGVTHIGYLVNTDTRTWYISCTDASGDKLRVMSDFEASIATIQFK